MDDVELVRRATDAFRRAEVKATSHCSGQRAALDRRPKHP